MKFRSLPALTAIALVTIMSAPAMAVLVVGSPQVNLGDVLPSPITAVSNDLLQTSLLSVIGEGPGNVRNGTTGTSSENNGTNPASIWGQTTTTYTLNTVTSALGYNITAINIFSGWNDDRADQSYRIFYSLVGSAAFIQLGGDITAGPAGNVQGSTLTRTFDTTGAAILTGVDEIRFVQFDGPAQFDGTGTVYREFDVIGSATAATVPEPTTAVMGFLALAALATRRRTA